MSNSKICRVILIHLGASITVFVSDDLVRCCVFALSLFKDFTEPCTIVVEQIMSDDVINDVLRLER